MWVGDGEGAAVEAVVGIGEGDWIGEFVRWSRGERHDRA